MFNAVLLGADRERARLFRVLAMASGQVVPLRESDYLPESYALIRLINTADPDLVILDLTAGQEALRCASQIRSHAPDLPIVGLGSEVFTAADFGRYGITVALPAEPDVEDFAAGMAEALHRLRPECERNLLTFMPSKAGSGASTVALHVAVALARASQERVLLIEADLRSGMIAEMIGARGCPSIQQVLAAGADLDAHRLENAVVRAHGVDFLLSNRAPGTTLPEWTGYFKLLEVARRRYDRILVDLPELVNPASVEFVRRARWNFTVCTPEPLSLKMASERHKDLALWGVPDSRLALLINRYHKNDPKPEAIEQETGAHVLGVFPNDYMAVRRAQEAGRPVMDRGKLTRAYNQFSITLDTEEPTLRMPSWGASLLALIS